MLNIRVLGSGTSQGVPVIACQCPVCTSSDPRDKRLRSSLFLEIDEYVYVIDTGPDFRQQMLREKVSRLDGVLFTHEHKDHVAGLDDVRAFNFIQKKDMPIYCTEAVEQALRREFHYVFAEDRYPGIPSLELHRIDKTSVFHLADGVDVQAIEALHYKMPVLGFRIGDFTYLTDAKTIEPRELDKIRGTRVLFVNALRITEHLSHFNLEEALQFIAEIQPEKAYLTHISHLFGTQEEIEALLPEGVYAAYDGLRVEIQLP
jgi:phosphoribosyl 1,2-cyclic phosphate phosphodiesterase